MFVVIIFQKLYIWAVVLLSIAKMCVALAAGSSLLLLLFLAEKTSFFCRKMLASTRANSSMKYCTLLEIVAEMTIRNNNRDIFMKENGKNGAFLDA